MKNCVISKESYHKKAFIHFMEVVKGFNDIK